MSCKVCNIYLPVPAWKICDKCSKSEGLRRSKERYQQNREEILRKAAGVRARRRAEKLTARPGRITV